MMMALVSVTPSYSQDWGRLLSAGVKTLQSFTISDSQIQQYVGEYIQYSDKKNNVAPANSPYTTRLNRIVSGITSVDGIPLNFKVYITKDVNAFACADGSVRVYSGLMDLMTDDEVLGVIGHEIGHVAHKDTKNAFKAALRTSALRDVIGSTGSVAAALTDSQLGALGETLMNNQYSQKQESNADIYAYNYLKQHGKNPLVLAMAFEKLEKISGGSSSRIMQAFSDHPDTQKRIDTIENLARKDGFVRPEAAAGKGTKVEQTSSVKSQQKASSKSKSKKKKRK